MKEDLNPLAWNISAEAVEQEQLKRKAEEDYEENFHFERTFSTESGQLVLEWLVKHTIQTPTWLPGRTAEQCYFREGQNNLVRQIEAKIKQSREYKEQK